MTDRADSGAGPTAAADVPPRDLTEDDAWGMVATLVSGPITWGLIGAGVDALAGTDRLYLPIGIVIGFITSIYIVYARYGRA